MTQREWRYPCPKCKARVGEPCTYLTDAQRWHGNEQIVLHRVGDPCVRSHNERLTYRPRSEHRPAPVPPMSPAMRAYMEYDRQEYQAMRAWLQDNARIFRPTRQTPAPSVES